MAIAAKIGVQTEFADGVNNTKAFQYGPIADNSAQARRADLLQNDLAAATLIANPDRHARSGCRLRP